MSNIGTVYLVGAGPGDPDLITRRGYDLLMTCDVVVYDNLAPHELIVGLPLRVERIFAGKSAGQHTLSQDEINALLVKLAHEGKRVVRLKGGDPFVFGRGGEEALYLGEHDIPFEIVPGITAGVAALAYAGIPATQRGMASFVVLATAHESGEADSAPVPWERLAQLGNGTLVAYMGVAQLPRLVEQLTSSGLSPQTPAAIIERGTTGAQRTITASLADLSTAASQAGVMPPALIVVGEVITLREKLRWFDRLPLFGKRVMITRPADQSVELYQTLRRLGAEVLALPTLTIFPENDYQGWDRLEHQTRPGDWLYFASENGVNHFLRQWRERGKDLRALSVFSIAVVGAGALGAFEPTGIRPDLVAAVPTTVGLAREMAEKLNLNGRRVVRIRGDQGDSIVDDILRSAGAEVLPLFVYRTLTAVWSDRDFQLLEAYPPDIILFSSGSAIAGLVQILGEEHARQLAAKAVTVSIGPTTTAAARAHGFPITSESATPSLNGLVQTLLDYFRTKFNR